MPTPKKKTKTASSGFSIPLYTLEGKETGSLDFPKELSGRKVNQSLLSQYMRVYLTNQRQGTASTKTRGEVHGSTRKIYRQKGTGKARHGSKKAPIFVGGGVVGGPKPKKYALKLNKKQKRLALSDAFRIMYQAKAIYGLDDTFNTNTKTKAFAQFLKKIQLIDKKPLLLLSKVEKNNLVRTSRNIRGLVIEDVRLANPYRILASGALLFTKEAVDALTKFHGEKHAH